MKRFSLLSLITTFLLNGSYAGVPFITLTSKTPPKISYQQRHDDRAPFIYITVHTHNDSVTYEKTLTKSKNNPSLFGSLVGTDLIVYPTGSKVWDWAAHTPNTHHRPGILPADVKELVEEHNVDIVILSKGVEEVLQTDPSTIDYLKKHKKQYHILETRQAINKYNELIAQGKKVGGLFHTTC
jgi:hypothetical protein